MADTGPKNLINQTLLNKIDQLRELNVPTVQLPQLVVVEDQSSGKSSVLESLTGFSFPQAPGLCTRYATQISCRREPTESVTVSIIPRPNAEAATEKRLRAFRHTASNLSNDDLVDIMQKANEAMGIRKTADDTDTGLQTFSEDILKIEISGPKQEHFTVIDVPGIFRVPSPPFTTNSDVALIRAMVESYMQNSRTIILAVMPSNVDISTQEILKMAETADPDGARTMGVLTKPDLVTEAASQAVIKDLVLGKKNKLRLGYCVVKNRSADDQHSTGAERLIQEQAFFSNTAWKQVSASGRCGVESLKTCLSDLLMNISKKEFPHVKADVLHQLDDCRGQLESIGSSRTGQTSQRLYLGKLASKFQAVTQCALNGHYDNELIFEQAPGLKLITAITKSNERFANEFWKNGHKRCLSPNSNDEGEKTYELNENENMRLGELVHAYPELHDVIETEDYCCPTPTAFNDDPIMDHIERVYESNRGPELGSFSGAILSITFKEQSEKWESLVLNHISNSIALVHDYIAQLLTRICADKQVRNQLWETLLVEDLKKAYSRAMNHARFLLRVERYVTPSTYNHYFNSEVQKKRQDRIAAAIAAETKTYDEHEPAFIRSASVKAVPISRLKRLTVDKDNTQQIREDILDVLDSYYKVSRKRFVDVVCRQVIGYFLLEGEESPLKLFTSDLVMGLSDDRLEIIAGEDAETKGWRALLESEIENLEAAMKVLRG